MSPPCKNICQRPCLLSSRPKITYINLFIYFTSYVELLWLKKETGTSMVQSPICCELHNFSVTPVLYKT